MTGPALHLHQHIWVIPDISMYVLGFLILGGAMAAGFYAGFSGAPDLVDIIKNLFGGNRPAA